MKNLLYSAIIIVVLWSCKTSNKTVSTTNVKEKTGHSSDTVRIANNELQYEIIIIDPGFNSWLASNGKPKNYYSLSYLENKNQFFVSEWNRRVLEPFRYSPDLYEQAINYQPSVHYGFEVNYQLYNYFIYFQKKYKQRL
jgi:hypothetical protein